MRKPPCVLQLLKSTGTLQDHNNVNICVTDLVLLSHGIIGEWMETVTRCWRYLLGSESWDQLGDVVPVYGLGYSPQGAQHHVQNQDVVVIGEVVVVRAVAAHLYRDRDKKRVVVSLQWTTLTSKSAWRWLVGWSDGSILIIVSLIDAQSEYLLVCGLFENKGVRKSFSEFLLRSDEKLLDWENNLHIINNRYWFIQHDFECRQYPYDFDLQMVN